MVDLRPDQLATVRAVLQAEVPDCEVWAFGSRAKWTARDTSDLDLAIVAKERLAFSRLSRLREAFEESYLPIKVDVLDFRKVSPEFQEVIKDQHVVLQESASSVSVAGKQWRTLPLEECVETIIDYRGKTPRKVSSGIPLITAKVVKGGRIEEPDEFIAPEDYDGWMRRGFPKPGDVLLTMEAPLGEVAQLDNRKVALAQRLVAIRGEAGVMDNTFLRYALQSDIVQDQLRSRATGTTVLGIRQSELRKINLPIPPLDEQRSIAQMLSTLDDKIESNRRMNATLEAMARALFQSWFVDFDPVRAKAEGRPPAGLDEPTAALFPAQFQDSELGEIPQGWKIRPLYSTAKYVNGAAFKSDHFCAAGDGLPVVKIAELKDGISAQTKYSKRQLEPWQLIDTGDLLYSWSGSPDTSLDAFLWTEGPGLLNQHIFKVVPLSMAEKRLVYYLLKYLCPRLVEIARDKQTTGLGHVTVADMKRLHVCWPSPQVLEAFDVRVGPIFDKAFANTLESQTLATLRDTLLPKLLSGEMSVTNTLISL